MKTKSPLTKHELKQILFENKLKELFAKEKAEGAFIFYIPAKGDVNVLQFGLCGHQILHLAEQLREDGEARLAIEEA